MLYYVWSLNIYSVNILKLGSTFFLYKYCSSEEESYTFLLFTVQICVFLYGED